MIPEQVWDQAGADTGGICVWPGETGSATPLAWSMAQFLRLVFAWKKSELWKRRVLWRIIS